MNKLGERDYVMLIAETLTDVYGETLKEGETDIKMAEAVLDRLSEFLYFHVMDISKSNFNKWKKERLTLDNNGHYKKVLPYGLEEYFDEDNE